MNETENTKPGKSKIKSPLTWKIYNKEYFSGCFEWNQKCLEKERLLSAKNYDDKRLFVRTHITSKRKNESEKWFLNNFVEKKKR